MTRRRGSGARPDRDPLCCPHDGATLTAERFCARGRGYPYLTYQAVVLEDGDAAVRLLATPCPFVCPLCRKPLAWDGRCDHCHGCTTGRRDDWTFPGDRYDLFDDKGEPLADRSESGGQHWIKTQGPRAAVSPTENAENMRMLRRVLARIPDPPPTAPA